MQESEDNFSLQPRVSSQFPITTSLGKPVCQHEVSLSVCGGAVLSSCLMHDSQEQEKRGINSKELSVENGVAEEMFSCH